VTLQEAKEILDAEVVVGHDRMDLDVKEAGCADLMTDVVIFGKAGMLLLTGVTSPDVIDTAYSLGIAAVITVRGKALPRETILLAEKRRMALLSTKYLLFEAVGRLYAKGLTACMEKAGE
jgi:hypothetical protein